MAEPLKNRFGPDAPRLIGDMLVSIDPAFERDRFVDRCLDGFDDLELTARARQISDVLADFLPGDRERALQMIIDSLPDPDDSAELTGMEGFRYLPYVYFVADHGLDHFETAMTAQYELTKRFTAEFSIRSFLEHEPDATLERLHDWAHDRNVHVRRLVSEGTRPRLPWAPRLPAFQADPSPVIGLLEELKDDPEEYVRRSVANNLNDISKDHPDRATQVARRWWTEGDEVRRKLVRHGLRTLVKRGDPAALEILGYGADSPIRVGPVVIDPDRVTIGDTVRIEITLTNPSDIPAGGLVDLRIHFVKANGSTRPKVFKGAEVFLPPGSSTTVRKTVSIAQQSTRTHYAGAHHVDVMLNGVTHDGGAFEVS